MKRVLVFLVAIALLAVIGAAIFIATFDLDRYRPQLTQEIEKALGRPVTIGRLKLGWDGRLALQAQQIAVLESEAAQAAPLIEVERVSAEVQLQPLLRKQIEITTLVIERPVIRASRNAQGQLNLVGPAVAAAPVAASGAQAAAGGAAAPMRFEIDSVRIENGTVHWRDEAAVPPLELALNKLDVDVKHIAPGSPMDISVRGALGQDRQNMSMTGRVTMPVAGTPLSASELRVELTDPPIRQFLPKDAPAVPVKSMAVSVPQFMFGRPLDLEVEAVVGADAPNVKFSGRLTLPEAETPGKIDQMKLSIDRLALEAIAPPPASPKDPQVRGTLSATLEGALPLDPAQMMRQLSAKGKLRVTDPAVQNLNVIREVLNKLAMLPGVADRLRSRLPPEYQAKLDANDTKFRPVETSVTIDYGVLRASELVLESDTFSLYGLGPINLAGPVSAPAWIRLDPDFSLAIIKSVNELQGLANPRGQLELPLTVTDKPPHVLPDLQYIASRLISNKVNEFLSDLLRGDEPEPGETPPGTTPPGTAPPQPQPTQPPAPAQPGQATQPSKPSGEEILGQFLQQILQPGSAENEAPAQP